MTLISPYDPTAENRTLPGPPAGILPPSTFPVGSSEWWIERLAHALAERIPRFQRLTHYYRGTQSVEPLKSTAWREAGLDRIFPRGLSANHSRLIVNGTAQRLTVLGFRLGGQVRADTEAARIWRANDMESMSDIALTESLVKGECPILVEPNPRDPATPIITPQDPCQMIVWHSPGDPRIRLAALKTWWDADVRRRVYILYLPDRIERWQDRDPGQMDMWLGRMFGISPARWQKVSGEDNPLGEVPVIVLPNEPLLAGRPEGEHESALDQIDHYNKVLMDMAVTSQELAFPQRWGIGVAADDEEESEQTPAVAAATGRVATGQTRWITSEAPDAQFGQFAAATIDNYVKELAEIRGAIAMSTFVPYHFLLSMPSSVAPSGESFTAAEVPLVDKVRGHTRDKGSGLRSVMRLAFLLAGDETRAKAMAMGATIWMDPERRTEAQHLDALGKMKTMLNVPEEAVWERIPVAPEEIVRWLEMRAAAPAPEVTTGAPGGPAAPDAGAPLAPATEQMSGSVDTAAAGGLP